MQINRTGDFDSGATLGENVYRMLVSRPEGWYPVERLGGRSWVFEQCLGIVEKRDKSESAADHAFRLAKAVNGIVAERAAPGTAARGDLVLSAPAYGIPRLSSLTMAGGNWFGQIADDVIAGLSAIIRRDGGSWPEGSEARVTLAHPVKKADAVVPMPVPVDLSKGGRWFDAGAVRVCGYAAA